MQTSVCKRMDIFLHDVLRCLAGHIIIEQIRHKARARPYLKNTAQGLHKATSRA
jgi:hypothetical protein